VEIYAQILSSDTLWLCNYLFAFILLRAAWTAPWLKLWRNPPQFSALIGLALWLAALWFFPVGVRDGLKLHPIGAALCFLIFDWQIASLMLSAILMFSLLYHSTSLVVLGNVGLIMVIMPIFISRWLLSLFYRYGKPNYFAFVLWNGYFSGALTMLVVALVNGWLIISYGNYSRFTMENVYFNYIPIICSAESALVGAFISGFAAFLPTAVAHFDQDTYFVKRPPEQ
jgi:uncharacterized membrane protein